MRTSDRSFRPAAVAALLLAASPAAAFELKSGESSGAPSATTLYAPPGPTEPVALGKGSQQEIWRDITRSYKSGDKQAALKQLEAAALQGDILAQWKLGRMYADGDGVEQDDFKAFQLFSRIADLRGDESRDSPHAGVVANAFVALGAYWLDGIPKTAVKANPSYAAKAFNYAAIYYGHPEAQYQLARMLMDGSATGKADPRMALRWLNLAAEKGHIRAQALLGRTLLTGEAVQRQPLRGLMWLQVARGNADAKRDVWIVEMHRKAFEAASEDERRQAVDYAERYLKASERR
jgi:hypothetical protein